MNDKLYSIGDVARRTGLTVSTIRFYADTDVIAPSSVTAAGYRLYDIQAVARLEFVRTLRELGASLDEIKQLLADNTSLRDLATTHLALVEGQVRRLRARQAVLRTVVRQDDPSAQVALMHKLVSMSDDDRNQLVDRFWDEITDGLQAHPGFLAQLRGSEPDLPAEPTTDQLEAWIELADLVQDEQFRRSLRESFRRAFSSERSRALTAPEVMDRVERHRQLLLEARAVSEAGLPADSDHARVLADRIAASASEISEHVKTIGPVAERRADALPVHARFMGLLGRYHSLMARVKGTPQPGTADATRIQDWLAAARGGGG
jgi:DNA-binding transcriptional MerR regulator